MDTKTEIRLIALDLDGTTLGDSGIAEETIKTLEAAIEEGVHVVIATGRTFTALPADIYKIKGLEYVISSNGAHITHLPSNETIYSNCASGEAMEEVSRILEAHPMYPIEVFTDGRAYIDAEVFEDIRENGSDYMSADYIMKTRTPVPEIYDFLRSNKDNIENINIHFRDFGDRLNFWERMKQVPGITVTSSFIHNIEIGGPTTSKATAIAELCEILGIEAKNVMACGDSPNDCAMIAASGLGVAMGNAESEVKALADFVTLSNVENGVAFAVKKFVLKKRHEKI